MFGTGKYKSRLQAQGAESTMHEHEQPQGFIAVDFPLQPSTVIYMVVIPGMGANVFRHFVQIKSLNVLHLPPSLEFSISSIKTQK